MSGALKIGEEEETMKSWKEQRRSHSLYIRKMLALSFGDFDVEEKVRHALIQAIRACDKSQIEKIELSGYTLEAILKILKKYGAYQYAVKSITERRAMIEAMLNQLFPRKAAHPTKRAILAALANGNYTVALPKLSEEQKRSLQESGLLEFCGLDVD